MFKRLFNKVLKERNICLICLAVILLFIIFNPTYIQDLFNLREGYDMKSIGGGVDDNDYSSDKNIKLENYNITISPSEAIRIAHEIDHKKKKKKTKKSDSDSDSGS